MNDIIEQIEKIKQINFNQNLVIFVGAGVSKNSGVCSWWELIKKIADKLGENKCNLCTRKKSMNADDIGQWCSNCEDKYNFSADDLLRLPQYFYETFGDSEDEKKPYYDFLEAEFCNKEYEPNDIDKLIVKLEPEHIITTNYDHLLENVKDPSVSRYVVITKDDDILSQKGRNYIIKMHGDIDDLKHIVLKEDDYLNYSQTHVIIETFIKSLLIDKTFLFIGYSLNDNNLKLIMSYIKFFVKEKGVNTRQPHYLVVGKVENPKYDILYWRNKGIELVQLSQISDYMLEQSKCSSIIEDIGKRLYAFLYYLNSEVVAYTSDNVKIMHNTLNKLKDDVSCFNFVSYRTIFQAFKLKSVSAICNSVMIFSDKKEYDGFKILAESEDLRKVLRKSGICGIKFGTSKSDDEVIFEDDQEVDGDILYELSIRNRYHEIMKRLQDDCPKIVKAYYRSLINYKKDLPKLKKELQEEYGKRDYGKMSNQLYYELAVYEFNKICMSLLAEYKRNENALNEWKLLLDRATARYSKAYITMKEITSKNADLQAMNDMLIKHEEYYMHKVRILTGAEYTYGELLRIKQVVYDYYLFYKKNHLMLDWFSVVGRVVTPYVKAIFCTYYPTQYHQVYELSGFPRTILKQYPLELLDVDMIVKHISLKDLRCMATYYKVGTITLSDKLDIAELFENFCLSMKEYWHIRMIDQLESFGFLLSLCKLNERENTRVTKAFVSLLTISSSENIKMVTKHMSALLLYARVHFDKSVGIYADLLEILVDVNILPHETMYDHTYSELVDVLSDVSNKKIQDKCNRELKKIEGDKNKAVHWAFVFRKILLKSDEQYLKQVIMSNIGYSAEWEVFQFIREGILPFNGEVQDYYKNKFRAYADSDIEGVITYPDNKGEAIDNLVLLVLLGIIDKTNIAFMEQYTYMSDYLDFIFHEEKFDYTKIKISDMMWCNFINTDYYRDMILSHKKEFWNKEEQQRIQLGLGSSYENRVAYKYLFD